MESRVIGATRALVLPEQGPPMADQAAILDAIGDAFAAEAQLVAIPASRLPDEFFDLSTRMAGEALQKFVNYHLQVAIVGDIERHVAASDALSAFVLESNRGHHVWFVPDMGALAARLEPAG